VRGQVGKKLSEWTAEYFEIFLKERNPAKNSIIQMKSNIRFIKASAFAEKQIDEISTLDVSNFLKETEKNRGPGAAAQTRGTLQDIFREAEVSGLIGAGKNPVTVTRAAKQIVKRDRLSLEQFLAIREHASTWLVNAMNLALLTGQRREDIAKAMFADVKDSFLYVQQTKTGAKLRLQTSLRLNAVGLSLDDVIKQCRDKVVSKYLIHRTTSTLKARAGSPIPLYKISDDFAAAREKAGVKPQEGKTPPSFHEIRSLAERLYDKECGPGFTQKLLGHKSASMTAVYHDSRGSEWTDVAAN
jgi:integrase